jgi:hypothetical protein
MNYEEECKKIDAYKPKEYFKPEEGKYELIILTEPEKTQYVEGTEVTPQITMEIEVNKKIMTWTVPVGKTYSSLYGQLMKLGKQRKGLREAKIDLGVKGKGKDKDYTILQLLKPVEEAVEEE